MLKLLPELFVIKFDLISAGQLAWDTLYVVASHINNRLPKEALTQPLVVRFQVK